MDSEEYQRKRGREKLKFLKKYLERKVHIKSDFKVYKKKKAFETKLVIDNNNCNTNLTSFFLQTELVPD